MMWLFWWPRPISNAWIAGTRTCICGCNQILWDSSPIFLKDLKIHVLPEPNHRWGVGIVKCAAVKNPQSLRILHLLTNALATHRIYYYFELHHVYIKRSQQIPWEANLGKSPIPVIWWIANTVFMQSWMQSFLFSINYFVTDQKQK